MKPKEAWAAVSVDPQGVVRICRLPPCDWEFRMDLTITEHQAGSEQLAVLVRFTVGSVEPRAVTYEARPVVILSQPMFEAMKLVCDAHQKLKDTFDTSADPNLLEPLVDACHAALELYGKVVERQG